MPRGGHASQAVLVAGGADAGEGVPEIPARTVLKTLLEARVEVSAASADTELLRLIRILLKPGSAARALFIVQTLRALHGASLAPPRLLVLPVGGPGSETALFAPQVGCQEIPDGTTQANLIRRASLLQVQREEKRWGVREKYKIKKKN